MTMATLTTLTFACVILAVSAQICPPTEVMFLFDQSENAARASSTDRVLTPFNLLKDAVTNFLTNSLVANAANFQVGAYGYSSSSNQVTIFPPGSSPSQALGGINNIGTGTNAGSWTFRGMEMVSAPRLQNNLLIIVTSQGSGFQARRDEARTQAIRLGSLGWRPYTIFLQGINVVDLEELLIVNANLQPSFLIDRNPVDPLDPKSYRELTGEFMSIINSILCTGTTTTTTTLPPRTRPTTPRVSGLCDNCLFDAGYGFDFDPVSCDTFYQCFPNSQPIKKHCPDGTFWDGSKCDHMNEVPCPTATCDSTTIQSRYTSGKCCNKLYECINGQLVVQNCPVGQMYDANSRGCFTPANITVSCESTGKYLCDVDMRGPIQSTDCAGYSPDPFGDPCKYLFMGISNSVAAGTRWEQSICSLTFSQGNLCLNTNVTDRDFTGTGGPAAVCNAVFTSTFDFGSRAVYSERLQRNLDVFVSVQEALLADNALIFNQQMLDPFLYYYFFNNRELASNIAFRLRFRLENAQINVEYDLLSNNYCPMCPETISITVTATSSARHVITATFLTDFGNTVSTSAILDKRNILDRMEIIVIFGDATVYGRAYEISNNNVAYQSVDFNTVSKESGSKIETNRCGIQIGRGSHRNFVGSVDDFSFYEYCQSIGSLLQ
uniref:Chitin-binding type-2 domain-containing protein n=1 Tax=Arion vulgaris TaxID=1028688 RepID=A0A0B7BB16_9EUPU